MISGMGQQNKLLEAMAMGLPCVTTSLVDNAIGASKYDAVLIAEDPETFATAILHLLDSEKEREILAVRAREFVSTHYHWDVHNKVLSDVLSERPVHQSTEAIQV
jgi:glycosyltransferase involved in cell wall biosynthesis